MGGPPVPAADPLEDVLTAASGLLLLLFVAVALYGYYAASVRLGELAYAPLGASAVLLGWANRRSAAAASPPSSPPPAALGA
jgi:CBS-domain-containing membrane protein